MFKSTFYFRCFLLLHSLYFLAQCTGKAPGAMTMAAIPQYGKDTCIFSLCRFATVNDDMKSTPAQLQQHATQSIQVLLKNDTIRQLIGTWTLVWGPVAYSKTQSDSTVSDNTMFLVKGADPANPSKTLYVLSIAGTNPVSVFDWASEDLDVLTMGQWPAPPTTGNNLAYFQNPVTSSFPNVTNAGKYISNGMCRGLNILFNIMQDPTQGISIMDCLKKEAGRLGSPVELAVTGHSLGGGLSPLAALLLKENQPYWDTKSVFNINTYPYAGPALGNMNFAGYFKQQMSGHFFGKYNQYDAIPHGMEAAMLAEIPYLYSGAGPDLQRQCLISSIIPCVSQKVSPFHYQTLYDTTNNAFAGKYVFSDSIYNAAIQQWNKLSDAEAAVFRGYLLSCGCNPFDAEAIFARSLCFSNLVYQSHVDAYNNYFGIQRVVNILNRFYVNNGTLSDYQLFKMMVEVPLVSDCVL